MSVHPEHRTSDCWAFLFWVPATLLVVLLSLVTLPSWLAYFATTPIRYEGVPFQVYNAPLHPGDTVGVVVYACNDSDQEVQYTISRYLERTDTGERFPVPPSAFVLQPGCHTVRSRLSVLPEDLPPGEYVLYGLSHVPTRWKEFAVPWHTVAFPVIAP